MKLDAKLGETHPFAHELAQGHWDIPPEAFKKGCRTDMATNAKLFKEFPYWCLIVVWNPWHVHHFIRNGVMAKHEGMWWVHEAHPQMLPREYNESFPLMFRRHDDGGIYVDRVDGEPMHPSECYQHIVKTLHMKDIFNTARYSELGDNIREADKSAEWREAEAERRLQVLRESVFEDEKIDLQTDMHERVSGFRSKR